MPENFKHHVNRTSLVPPFPDGMEQIIFGMGCFWGAERCFWQQDGVYTTAAGYAGGKTSNPDYREVCTGLTGHAEVVLVVFDPGKTSLGRLLNVFWESHDPTQGDRQGNDFGNQYRSVIYCQTPQQLKLAKASRDRYQQQLKGSGFGKITTEIRLSPDDFNGGFNYAEEYHQQYLSKNPGGYCGLRGTGVSCQEV